MPIYHIRVKAGASKDKVLFDDVNQIWVFYIRAKPINGEANVYLIHYISDLLKIPKREIQIVRGENSPYKQISIDMPLEAFKKN